MTFDDYARNLTETIDDNRLQAALETNGQSEHLHDKRNNYGRVINLSCKHKQKANDERERERERERDWADYVCICIFITPTRT